LRSLLLPAVVSGVVVIAVVLVATAVVRLVARLADPQPALVASI
jgi:hypothetical protein